MDLSKLSDDDLRLAYEAAPAPRVQPGTAPQADLASVSDADLLRMHRDLTDAPAAGGSGDAAAAVGRGIVEGVPVAGPYLLGGLNRAIAGVRALKNDTRFSDELRTVEDFGHRTAGEHPIAAGAGEIAGGVIGAAPLVAAAPAAFGAGAGPLLVRSAAGLASGAGLGAADSAVRSDGDLASVGVGAGIGGALGAAGPGVGRLVGKGVAALTGGEPGMNLVREAAHGLTDSELASAQFIRDAAASGPAPVRLSLGEALNRATGGKAVRASQLERVAANSGGEGGRIAGEFYAARPAEVDGAGRALFDQIGREPTSPTDLGFDVQAAARRGVAQTPEGIGLAGARAAVGPRVTTDQAGRVIQPEMRSVFDARDAARTAQANTDYAAARAAPERFGIERTVQVERPGEPVLQTLDTGGPRPPAYQPPPEGPDTLGSLAPRRPDGPAVPQGGQGKTLARFMAENGGIGLERGDVKAVGLDRFQQPGVAKLVRDDGKGIDSFWRERLIEEGYLPPDRDGGMQRNVHDEVLNLLDEEARGRPTRPYDWQGRDDLTGHAQVRDEFQAAASRATADLRGALRGAGVDPATVHPAIVDRAAAAMVKDGRLDPLDAYDRAVMAMREPASRGPTMREVPTTVREEIPDVRFVQVDPRPAVDAAAQQGRTAKGDIRGALAGYERDLHVPGGDLDTSVEGLRNARGRLDASIQAAAAVGDREKAAVLQGRRAELDARLKEVPELARADANFAANSVPLEPFQGNAPLAQVTRREGNMSSGRFVVPSEEVLGHLQGATAAREFLANATPAARRQYEGSFATKLLDGATDRHGDVDAANLSAALRDHADVLEQMPDVYHRLDGVVRARDGLARVEASPLGQLARINPDIEAATRVLFGQRGLGSHTEVANAMGAIVRNDPRAAESAARFYLETAFNQAMEETRGLAPQYGGAGWASAIRGNPQQRRNLEAMFSALPEGATRWKALDGLLTTLEATGYRPQKGSDTAFNRVIQKEFASGKTHVGQAVSDALTGAAAGTMAGGPKGGVAGFVVGAKHGLGEAMTRAQMAGSGEAVARLMFDKKALPDLRALAKSPPGSRNAELFTHRLMLLANGGAAPARDRGSD